MERNNIDRNEAVCRNILCSVLPVCLFLVLRFVCTVMLVIDEIEPGASVSDRSSRADWLGTDIGKASVDVARE